MKILNFGSMNIDYVYDVEHFVRPGETISATKMELFCGGKGLNQSIALARSGAGVFHAGKIGKDGEMLLERLKENKVDTSLIRFSTVPSGHAIIQVERKGQNCILLFGGANQDVGEKDIDEILASFEEGDILLLQNEISNLGYIIDKASEIGMRIALNPSPINDSIRSINLLKIEWLILNEIEGNEMTGKKMPDEILASLLSSYPQIKVVLTLGKDGVVYKDITQECRNGIYDVSVVDTTAAGDTFTGYFISSVATGLPVDKAIEKASIASSISVSKKGASDSIPTKIDVENSRLRLL